MTEQQLIARLSVIFIAFAVTGFIVKSREMTSEDYVKENFLDHLDVKNDGTDPKKIWLHFSCGPMKDSYKFDIDDNRPIHDATAPDLSSGLLARVVDRLPPESIGLGLLGGAGGGLTIGTFVSERLFTIATAQEVLRFLISALSGYAAGSWAAEYFAFDCTSHYLRDNIEKETIWITAKHKLYQRAAQGLRDCPNRMSARIDRLTKDLAPENSKELRAATEKAILDLRTIGEEATRVSETIRWEDVSEGAVRNKLSSTVFAPVWRVSLWCRAPMSVIKWAADLDASTVTKPGQ